MIAALRVGAQAASLLLAEPAAGLSLLLWLVAVLALAQLWSEPAQAAPELASALWG